MTEIEYIQSIQNTTNIEDIVDFEFIQRIQQEVTVSCALPLAVPMERIPLYIMQAAQWFWENDDFATEERFYLVANEDVCRQSALNKVVKLPPQIMSVAGVFKTNNYTKYGAMGDFSVERMMLSSYSMYAGMGTIGGGFTGTQGATGYNLTDVVTAMYEVDTFNQTLNAPVSFNFNPYSSTLILMGNISHSDIMLNVYQRSKIQDLYKSYYFFRFVVCLVKRALSTIYGTFSFKLPGGIEINYDTFKDDAKEELDEIKEEITQKRRSNGIIFMPNTI